MKKIININLAGRVIPIEDTAYEKLQAYIESLRRYFAKEEGRDEIINDIESRVAELMNDKIRKGATCVTDDDIDEITASMGRPEDFDAEDIDMSTGKSTGGFESAYAFASSIRKRNRLYRDANDKILGGVCAGLAAYLNIDPAIVRLLFAIITFGGFGFGVLLYIVLWIVLPVAPLELYGGKRLYRNPDDRVIGGVASGLAAYFNKETWAIRLIFAAPMLLNILIAILSVPFFHQGAFFPNIAFGSLTGTFILAYIIMWIVLPEANTEYQKMEMRGEKVDVNSIRQNVQDRAKEFGEEVKMAAQNFSNKAKEFSQTRGKTFSSEVSAAARRTGTGLGNVIGIIFKAFFIIVAGSIAFALFVALMALIFGGVGIWPLKNFILDGFWQNAFAWGTLIFFLGVPLVAFITWLVRRMMRVRSQRSYLGWTFGGLWVLGWVSITLLVSSIINDFRTTAKQDTPMEISQPASGKMIVRVFEPAVQYSGSFGWIQFDGDDEGWDITEDSLRMANIKVRIEKSLDTNYYVTVSRYSAGRNRAEAAKRASAIHYNTSVQDSILNLGSGLTVEKFDKFRLQRIIVNIKVPVGKKIRFDESVDRLHPYNVRIYRRNRWNRNDYDIDWDWDNYFAYNTNVDYVMGGDGELYDPNAPKNSSQPSDNTPQDGGYRYNPANENKSLEQREKELKQELKQIEEQKNKNGRNADSVGSVKEDSHEKGEVYAEIGLSPSFLLAKVMY